MKIITYSTLLKINMYNPGKSLSVSIHYVIGTNIAITLHDVGRILLSTNNP